MKYFRYEASEKLSMRPSFKEYVYNDEEARITYEPGMMLTKHIRVSSSEIKKQDKGRQEGMS